ncbi:MAG: hypothetical protein Terrestrivirus1_239 [Terrestrivirus sp.]|uniref:Fe2OG dioxygenase domain-containing protein n=1 Tax=Terrestrivirus sp. TaxID=2487775 RepID=A0A3G4ZKJ5_9VIRU|nr:MAG: hypothetical protein Terrestrivirus1_239 [Terrestrivirus sp.]
MFEKFILDIQTNIFEQLANSCEFEDVTVGRKGANLINYKNDLIPLVRTTSSYSRPAQPFSLIHYVIINKIKTVSNNDTIEFNNALAEIYDRRYTTMGYHSDQTLDLADDSCICLFSCYRDLTDTTNVRKLKIKNKETNECSEIQLDHNSIVLFSVPTNKNHLHKIVLENNNNNNNSWLGITFRLSKTFIKFINEIPYFYPEMNRILKLANDEEKKEFYKQRSKENSNVIHNYPEIDYTISVSDILPIN